MPGIGIFIVIFVSFARGHEDPSGRFHRSGRSLPDAIVFAALSHASDTPRAFGTSPRLTAPHHIVRVHRSEMKPPQQRIENRGKVHEGKTDGILSKYAPPSSVEVVKSVEMEFDETLQKLVPVKQSEVEQSATLLSQKTKLDLRDVMKKFEKEKEQLRIPGPVKNFQTGRFKSGHHVTRYERPIAFVGNDLLLCGGSFPEGALQWRGAPGGSRKRNAVSKPSLTANLVGEPDFKKCRFATWKTGIRTLLLPGLNFLTLDETVHEK